MSHALAAQVPPHEPQVVHLHISPMRSRCGLVAFEDDSTGVKRSLLLLVLPKLWRAEGQDPAGHQPFPRDPRDPAWQDPEGRLRVLAYEGDRQRVVCPDEGWRSLFERCAEWLAERDETGEVGDGAREGEGEGEGELDAATRGSLRGLLSLASGTPRVPKPWRADPSALTKRLAELLRLVVFSRDWRPHRQLHSPRDDGPGYLVGEGRRARHDPLRFLTAHAFVREVEARAREVRQGYVPTTEWMAVIRGRMTARGMARVALTRAPRVECEYDRFTAGVTLFQVLVTALDHVASGAAFPPLVADLTRALREDALRVRRELAHIPSLPVAVAAHHAGRVRLSRLQRGWQTALDMARLLLQRLPLELTDHTRGQSGLVWVVQTPKVWEGILEQALRARGWEPHPQQPVPSPWVGLGGGSNVDLFVEREGVAYVLDAKYKLGKPGKADQYQIFAYSHLVSTAHATRRAALLYPLPPSRGDEGSAPPAPPRTYARARSTDPGAPSGDVTLTIAHVPFPAPETLTAQAWPAYLERTGGALTSALESHRAPVQILAQRA